MVNFLICPLEPCLGSLIVADLVSVPPATAQESSTLPVSSIVSTRNLAHFCLPPSEPPSRLIVSLSFLQSDPLTYHLGPRCQSSISRRYLRFCCLNQFSWRKQIDRSIQVREIPIRGYTICLYISYAQIVFVLSSQTLYNHFLNFVTVLD